MPGSLASEDDRVVAAPRMHQTDPMPLHPSAVATLVLAAPCAVCAQEWFSAPLVKADSPAWSNLFGPPGRRPSPYRHLFVTDADSPLVVKPKSHDQPTVNADHVGVESSPLPSILRTSLHGAQPQTPPEPAHTGFRALIFETASDFNAYPRRQSTWVILGIGGAAAALAHPADACQR